MKTNRAVQLQLCSLNLAPVGGDKLYAPTDLPPGKESPYPLSGPQYQSGLFLK